MDTVYTEGNTKTLTCFEYEKAQNILAMDTYEHMWRVRGTMRDYRVRRSVAREEGREKRA